MTTHEGQTSSDTDTSAETEPPDTGPTQAGSTEAGSTEAGSTETETDMAAVPAESSTEGDQLIPQETVMDFNARWEAIQQGFVDNPRSAVSDADALVGDVLEELSAAFDEQHGRLEAQWSDGEPDTEDLRSALQRYRDLFDRLLTI